MSAHRLPDDEHHEAQRSERGRDDLLRLVRQHLSQTARVVRLRGRIRRASGGSEPVAPPAGGPDGLRD